MQNEKSLLGRRGWVCFWYLVAQRCVYNPRLLFDHGVYTLNVYMYYDEIILDVHVVFKGLVYILRQYIHSNKLHIHNSNARKGTHSELQCKDGYQRTNHQPRIMVSTSWSKRKGSDISTILHNRNKQSWLRSSCMAEMKIDMKTHPRKAPKRKETRQAYGRNGKVVPSVPYHHIYFLVAQKIFEFKRHGTIIELVRIYRLR